jgi:hypothetical protein
MWSETRGEAEVMSRHPENAVIDDWLDAIRDLDDFD